MKGGLLFTPRDRVRPSDGDNPGTTPPRFQPKPASSALATPVLLPATSAAGVVLRATPDKRETTGQSSGTRGTGGATAAASPAEEKKKTRTKLTKPPMVRGAFFGVAVRN